jgi:hypothetical protein
MNKPKKIMDETTNSNTYNKAKRHYIDEQDGKCSWCPWHRGHNQRHNVARNWKKYRKTQYKDAPIV